MGTFLPSQSLWDPHSSSSPQAVELPGDIAGLSHGGPSISFGAPVEDQISIAVLVGGLEFPGDEDPATLFPLGTVVLVKSDQEVTAMLARAGESVGLE